MRLSEGVEWGIHCVTVLALLPPDAALPAAKLAEFHDVPPAYLAKAMQSLARHGIVESVPGRRGGYRMAKAAADVTLLDVVEAIDGDDSTFRCSEIRRRGPAKVGARQYAPVCTIAAAMYRADEAWRRELRATTVAELVGGLSSAVPPEAAAKAVVWMRDAVN